MAYGYKEYISIKSKGDRVVEEQIIQNAILAVKDNFRVEVGFDNCTFDYDYLDTRISYPSPVARQIGNWCYDESGNLMEPEHQVAMRVYMNPLKKQVPTLL